MLNFAQFCCCVTHGPKDCTHRMAGMFVGRWQLGFKVCAIEIQLPRTKHTRCFPGQRLCEKGPILEGLARFGRCKVLRPVCWRVFPHRPFFCIVTMRIAWNWVLEPKTMQTEVVWHCSIFPNKDAVFGCHHGSCWTDRQADDQTHKSVFMPVLLRPLPRIHVHWNLNWSFLSLGALIQVRNVSCICSCCTGKPKNSNCSKTQR